MTKEDFRQQIGKQENVSPQPAAKLQAEVAAAATKVVAKEADAVSLQCQKKRERKQQVRADNNNTFAP
jgi:hypothetical protein